MFTSRHLTLSALALAACAGGTPPDDLGYDGTGLAVTIAPLDLPSVSDACYSFDILNGSEQRVVARGSATGGPAAGLNGDGGPAGLPTPLDAPLCSSRFGNSQGALSYVAPCDTSDNNQQHTVTLWVNSVCQRGQGTDLADPQDPDDPACLPLQGFVNPCGPAGCALTATCQENADTPVQFNFTLMAAAQQGFFDVAVSFDSVFCSAKLDTCHGQDPILLLHDSQGTRRHTAVAAVACTAGAGDTTTHLHMTDLVIDCGGTQHTLAFGSITAEGNRPIGDLQGAVYFGTEDLPTAGGPAGSANKVFTHVAFILPNAPTTCDLSWTVAPTDHEDPPLTGTGSTFANVAVISFDVTGLTAGACTNHPLNAPGSGVTTTYLEEDPDYSASLAIGMTAFSGQSQLPTIEGLILHLDASTLTANEGSPVDVWPNLVTGTADATQSTANARPVVTVDAVTGLRMLNFDGQDDFMSVPAFMDLATWTIAVVFRGRPASVGQFRGLFEFATTGQTRRGIGIGTSGEPIIVFPAAYRTSTSTSALTDTTRVLVGRNAGTGASATLSLDGVPLTLSNQASYGTANTLNQGIIGNYTVLSNAYSFRGELAEILVYDNVISDEDLGVLSSYLQSKWAPP